MKELPKKVFFITMSFFLMWRSYNLVFDLHLVQNPSFIHAFFYASLLNIYILGVFAFAGFALPTQKLLSKSFYKIRNRKRLKKWNRTLGVEYFRKFLLATVWKNKDNQKDFFGGKKSSLDNLETNAEKSEFGHLIPFWIMNGLVIYILLYGNYKLAIFTFAINVFINLYPILLQRDHRRRIAVLKNRYKYYTKG